MQVLQIAAWRPLRVPFLVSNREFHYYVAIFARVLFAGTSAPPILAD